MNDGQLYKIATLNVTVVISTAVACLKCFFLTKDKRSCKYTSVENILDSDDITTHAWGKYNNKIKIIWEFYHKRLKKHTVLI